MGIVMKNNHPWVQQDSTLAPLIEQHRYREAVGDRQSLAIGIGPPCHPALLEPWPGPLDTVQMQGLQKGLLKPSVQPMC